MVRALLTEPGLDVAQAAELLALCNMRGLELAEHSIVDDAGITLIAGVCRGDFQRFQRAILALAIALTDGAKHCAD